MRVFQRFPTQHADLIHDVSYDFYGKRMATCSSDQSIKVWDQDENAQWVATAEWKAHSGSIWKVAWAHPEFGQVIASCSFDRTVCIWEEGEADEKSSNRKWIERARLVDSPESLVDIKFAPRHMGLKLATCSADGMVRIYEAIDVMSLAHWPLTEEFEAFRGGVANCISWNPSPFDRAMLAVGSSEPSVKIWEYNDAYRKWAHVETLLGGSERLGPEHRVHDVCWAPNMGRSYHLIAAAVKDSVRIWRLKVVSDKPKLEVEEVLSRHDHRSEVWRVEWNITGTILASSGDDGNVRLWKSRPVGDKWGSFSVIGGEDGEDGEGGQEGV